MKFSKKRLENVGFQRKIIVLSLVLMLLVAGCGEKQDPDAPPNPSAPGGRTAIAGQAYAADGVCYTDQQLENLFAVDDSLLQFQGAGMVDIGGGRSSVIAGQGLDYYVVGHQWVYGTAYILKNCDEWIPFDYIPIKDSEFFRETNWIRVPSEKFNQEFYSSSSAATSYSGQGQSIAIDDSFSTEGAQYIATFVCNIADEGWDCNDGKWAMFRFNVQAAEVEADLCADVVQNQDETDVDCGGVCGECADGMACNLDDDCEGFCDEGSCLTLVDVEGPGGDECIETDAGIDPEVRGTTSGQFWRLAHHENGSSIQQGDIDTFTDYCYDQEMFDGSVQEWLMEARCNDEGLVAVGGDSCRARMGNNDIYVCRDGACVEGPGGDGGQVYIQEYCNPAFTASCDGQVLQCSSPDRIDYQFDCLIECGGDPAKCLVPEDRCEDAFSDVPVPRCGVGTAEDGEDTNSIYSVQMGVCYNRSSFVEDCGFGTCQNTDASAECVPGGDDVDLREIEASCPDTHGSYCRGPNVLSCRDPAQLNNFTMDCLGTCEGEVGNAVCYYPPTDCLDDYSTTCWDDIGTLNCYDPLQINNYTIDCLHECVENNDRFGCAHSPPTNCLDGYSESCGDSTLFCYDPVQVNNYTIDCRNECILTADGFSCAHSADFEGVVCNTGDSVNRCGTGDEFNGVDLNTIYSVVPRTCYDNFSWVSRDCRDETCQNTPNGAECV